MWVSPWIRLAADSRCPTVGTRRTRSQQSGYLSPTSKTSTTLSGRILVLALPIWQTPATAEHRLELTLWQALACAVGTVVTIAVEAVFHSLHPHDELLHGLDDRLSAVQGLIDAYAEDASVPEEVSNRVAKYTVVGVGGLRRMLRTNPDSWRHAGWRSCPSAYAIL
jgi:hypothetical protein